MPGEVEAITQQAPDLIMQGGFAGFSVVLLVILFWLIRQLIALQKETNTIIAEGSETNKKVLENITQQTVILTGIHDRTLELNQKLDLRPCLQKYK